MKNRRAVVTLLQIGFTLGCVAGCGHSTLVPPACPGFMGPQVLIQAPPSVAAGNSAAITATTGDSVHSPPTWQLETVAGSAPGTSGTLAPLTGLPDDTLYIAPPVPPIYPGALGSQQGWVTIDATVLGASACGVTNAVASFPITAPTVTVGLSPVTATVALSGSVTFNGYAVGNVNNALTWQVNGVTGGSAATGNITNGSGGGLTYISGGLYTAPAIMPMTGANVTITMISQADPTKTQTAVVTLH